MNNTVVDNVKAWEAFCDQLKEAGSILARDTTPEDELSQAEGLRKLVRMIRVGFEATLEYADSRNPRVYQLVTETTTGEGETSDARYYQAIIDGSRTYRLHGRRGDAPFMEMTVYNGKIGLDESSGQVGAITEADLQVDDEGYYELILSPEPHDGNWIKTDEQARILYIRQYAHDWNSISGATFAIEQLDSEPGQTPPINLARVKTALRQTAAYVTRSTTAWANIVDYRRSVPANQFYIYEAEVENPDDSPEMPIGHRFSSGYFRIEPDKALLVTFKPVTVPYWGLDLTNYWFEPLSYGNHDSNVNNSTAIYNKDGTVNLVIASRDPGTSNWLDTKGHLEGTMLFRWSRTSEPVPEIDARLVSLQDLEASWK